MARPQTFTHEELADAAFDLTRREGLEGLTVRAVAKAIGCSTQPIYTSFGSVEQLREEVESRIEQFIADFLSEPEPNAPPLLGLAQRTIRLSLDEPQLYRLATAIMGSRFAEAPPASVRALMEADPMFDGCTPEDLVRIHQMLWIFTIGLCELAGPEEPIRCVEDARPWLEAAGLAVISLAGSPMGMRGSDA